MACGPKAVFAILTLSAFIGTWGLYWCNGGVHELWKAVADKHIPKIGQIDVVITGVPWLEDFLQQNVIMNLPLLIRSPYNPAGRPLTALLMSNVLVILFVFVLAEEATQSSYAVSRARTLCWVTAIGCVSTAVVLPVYALLHLDRLKDWTRNTRRLPKSSIMAVALGVLLGFGFTAYMSFDPYGDGLRTQCLWIAAFTAFYVCMTLTQILAGAALSPLHARACGLVSKPASTTYISHVLLIFLGLMAAFCHIVTFFLSYLRPSFFSKADGRPASSQDILLPDLSARDMHGTLMTFMQVDYLLTGLWAVLVSCFILNVRFPCQAGWNALLACLGSIMLSPGAVLALTLALENSQVREMELCVTAEQPRSHTE